MYFANVSFIEITRLAIISDYRRIHPNDRVRIERALESYRLTRRPLSADHARHGFADRPFEVRWLGIERDRELLWERLRQRVDRMFSEGLVEEVRSLHASGYGPELRPLQAIGYREVAYLLEGRISEAEAREAIWVASRRYAKRQWTWFRAEPGLRWLDAGDPDSVLESALAELNR